MQIKKSIEFRLLAVFVQTMTFQISKPVRRKEICVLWMSYSFHGTFPLSNGIPV